MDDDVTEYPTRRLRLYPCKSCGRQFNSETINKHQAICRKVATKKRRVFDAGRQRAAGSDVPYKATRQTAQIYNGEIQPQNDRSRYGKKPNWREKHRQLIQSIREARTVTRAMKQGGPLPAFRPSEVPSDYVNCPYCHRNFSQQAGQRHIPYCQSKHGQKQTQNNLRNNQQYDRGRSFPSPQYRQQQSYSTSAYSGSHDAYNNGYKHTNSAPMKDRRNLSEYQQVPPIPAARKAAPEGNSWGLKKIFGFGSKQPPPTNYYEQDNDDDYYYQQQQQQSARRPPVQQKSPLMRTGRTQQNTDLNVRARQRIDDNYSYARRAPAPPQTYSSSSYNGQTRSQYGNNQYNSSMRPSAVSRAQPAQTAVRCYECGSAFSNMSARYCPQCGSRR